MRNEEQSFRQIPLAKPYSCQNKHYGKYFSISTGTVILKPNFKYIYKHQPPDQIFCPIFAL
jgi:hypothetical protein